MKPVKEFLGHLHAFRALAIVFMVAGHALDAFAWREHPFQGAAIRVFAGNGSTLFVFIAGYLFQHLSARFRLQDYWRSKLRHVVLPYLLVSLPALVFTLGGIERDGAVDALHDGPVWEHLGYHLLTGSHLAPLWFVPMICLFYLAAPVLLALDRRPRLYLLWPLLLLLTLWVGRGLPPQSFVHFLSFYTAGMVCSHYRQAIDPWLVRPGIWGGLLVLALLLGLVQLGVIPVTTSGEFPFRAYSWNALQKLALCLAVLGALRGAGARTDRAWIGELADLSFGIFFIHSYLISATKLTYTHGAGDLPEGQLLQWCLLSLGVLWLCTQLLRFIKRLAGPRSRWLVGC